MYIRSPFPGRKGSREGRGRHADRRVGNLEYAWSSFRGARSGWNVTARKSEPCQRR